MLHFSDPRLDGMNDIRLRFQSKRLELTIVHLLINGFILLSAGLALNIFRRLGIVALIFLFFHSSISH